MTESRDKSSSQSYIHNWPVRGRGKPQINLSSNWAACTVALEPWSSGPSMQFFDFFWTLGCICWELFQTKKVLRLRTFLPMKHVPRLKIFKLTMPLQRKLLTFLMEAEKARWDLANLGNCLEFWRRRSQKRWHLVTVWRVIYFISSKVWIPFFRPNTPCRETAEEREENTR